MAGLLAYRFGIGVMFIDALLLLFGALTLLPYLNVEVRENVGEVEAEKRMKLNLRLTIGVIVTVLLFNFALGSFRIFVFASLRVLWKGEVLYGILQSLTTVGSLVAVLLLAYLATRRLIGLKRPLTVGMFLQAFALIVVGFPSVLVLFPAVLLMGFGGGLLNVSFDSLMQRHLPLGSLGTARGIFDTFATLVIPLSQLTFAWMIEGGTRVSNASFLAASLGFAAVALLTLSLRHVDEG